MPGRPGGLPTGPQCREIPHTAAPGFLTWISASSPQTPGRRSGIFRDMKPSSLLRVPLFYKLSIANAAVLVLAAGLSAFFLLRAPDRLTPGSLIGIVGASAAIGVIVGTLANAALVRLALRPLHRLEATARAVGDGDLDARVGTSVLADRDLDEVMLRFDEMLDSVQEARSRQHELAARLVESEERTRRRVAGYLYEDTAQRLATVLLSASRILRETDSSENGERLIRLRDDLAAALDGVRRAARRLRPPELDDIGVVAALRAEARGVSLRSELSVEVEHEGGPLRLDRMAEVTLFRVVQRALDALADAGERGRVVVRLASGPDGLECEIVGPDDFGAAASGIGTHEGAFASAVVHDMIERARWIGGEVVLEPDPEAPVSVRILVPDTARTMAVAT